MVASDYEQRKHRQFTHESPVNNAPVIKPLYQDYKILKHLLEYSYYFTKDFIIIVL